MKIYEGFIGALRNEGRQTLQVPDIVISFAGSKEKVVEVPDNWFIRVYGEFPSVGREEGFLYLSKIGFENNKNKLKKEYFSGFSRRNGRKPVEQDWKDFEDYAENFFVELKKNLDFKIFKSKNKLREAKFKKSKKSIKFWENKIRELQEIEEKV